MSKKIISPFEFVGDINDIKRNIKAAIEEKGVDMTDVVRFDEYPDKIREIGGGQPDADAELVTFYDYDGTIIKSYTVDEFASVTELPSPPTHDRLTFQGWNWSIEDIKAMGRAVDVGATYTTSSGKSEFDFIVNAVTGFAVTMRFYNVTDGDMLTVDWGDGTSDNAPSTAVGVQIFTHTYNAAGDYIATVDSAGAYYPYGTTTSPYNMFNVTPSYICTAARLGVRCASIGNNAFYNCHNLTNIIIPSGVTSIGSNAFYKGHNLTNIIIPSGVTIIDSNAFSECYSLTNIIIYGNATSIDSSAFYRCRCLTSVMIYGGVTSIGSNAFSECYSLTNIIIPSGVTSIGNNAFYRCTTIKKYTMLPATPPTLKNISAFEYINQICVIEVPKGSLSAYQTATNWSTYAAYMVESAE